MKRLTCFLSVIILVTLAIAMPSYCQKNVDDEGTFTIQGQITSLNWIPRVIVVRWQQIYPTIRNDEMTLKVPEGLSIMKGADTVSFNDLHQFDRVTVTYQIQSVGLPKVVRMSINNKV